MYGGLERKAYTELLPPHSMGLSSAVISSVTIQDNHNYPKTLSLELYSHWASSFSNVTTLSTHKRLPKASKSSWAWLPPEMDAEPP